MQRDDLWKARRQRLCRGWSEVVAVAKRTENEG